MGGMFSTLTGGLDIKDTKSKMEFKMKRKGIMPYAIKEDKITPRSKAIFQYDNKEDVETSQLENHTSTMTQKTRSGNSSRSPPP